MLPHLSIEKYELIHFYHNKHKHFPIKHPCNEFNSNKGVLLSVFLRFLFFSYSETLGALLKTLLITC